MGKAACSLQIPCTGVSGAGSVVIVTSGIFLKLGSGSSKGL